MVSTDPNIAYDKIVGTSATIRLELNQKTTRYFNGLVSRFVLTQVDKGFAHYRMTLVPWLWFLTRTSDCQIFQKKRVPDIIQEVFREHGFSDFRLALTGHYDPWDYCVQYRETDFNFVSRLMEHEGIYYFFEHENGKHTLVLADSPTAHKPKAGGEKVVFRPNPDGAKDKDYIHSFLVEQEVQPGRYVLNEYNFQKPKTSLKGQTDHSKPHAKGDFEIYDYPGEYEESSHGKDYTQIRIEELHAQHETARGQSNDRAMATGATFTLGEFPRQDWNKKYLITSTSIHITNDEYESGGQSGGDFYSCSFTAIPASVQYRAPRLTPKPLIQGVQTAMVTGPKNKEVYIDEHSRVKVQFHWDRRGQRDENSSCWIRVSQGWAGGTYGGLNFPRIGHEVIVDFEEGDPDRPIITGRVYNAAAMPPPPNAGREDSKVRRSRDKATAKKQNSGDIKVQRANRKQQTIALTPGGGPVPVTVAKSPAVLTGAEERMPPKKPNPFNEFPTSVVQAFMMSTIRSDSLDGKQGMNEITMNDTGGEEGLFTKAQKDNINTVGNDRETTIVNDELVMIGNDRTETVGNDETIEIGHDRLETVGHDETIEVGNDRHETVGNNEDIEIGNDRTEQVGNDEKITVGHDRIERVGNDESIQITGNRTEKVGKDESTEIGGKEDHTVVEGIKIKCKTTTTEADQSNTLVSDDLFIAARNMILADGNKLIQFRSPDQGGAIVSITPTRIELKVGASLLAVDKNGIFIGIGGSRAFFTKDGVRIDGAKIDLNP